MTSQIALDTALPFLRGGGGTRYRAFSRKCEAFPIGALDHKRTLGNHARKANLLLNFPALQQKKRNATISAFGERVSGRSGQSICRIEKNSLTIFYQAYRLWQQTDIGHSASFIDNQVLQGGRQI